MLAEEVAEEICEYVVDDDEHGRDEVVDDSFEDIAAHEPGGAGADESSNDDPAEESELILQESLFQAQDKSEKADNTKRKADKVVVEKQLSDERVLHAQIGQLCSHKLSQLVVVIGDEDKPVNVFSHGDFYFLLLIALDIVDLHKDHEV